MPPRVTSSPARKSSLLLVARTARPLAQMAREAGYDVHVIDLFGDEDTREAARSTTALAPNRHFDFDPGQLQGAIAAHHSLRGAMPIVCGSAFERAPALLATLARDYAVFGCAAPVYRQLLDLPALFDDLKRREGIASPATSWQRPARPRGWLCKQAGSSGGDHVAMLHVATAPRRRQYFQRRVYGASLSALFIANGREARYYGCAAHLRWHAQPGFRYEGARLLPRVPAALRADIERIGAILTARLGLRGCFGFDFLWREGSAPVLLDINPRPTATLELWPERHRMFVAHLAACTDGTLLYSSPRVTRARGHLVLYADAPWQVRANVPWPTWTADRPPAGTHIPRGAPLCTLLGDGENEAALARQLAQRYAALRALLGAAAHAVLPATINIRSM